MMSFLSEDRKTMLLKLFSMKVLGSKSFVLFCWVLLHYLWSYQDSPNLI
jgi:hypothetical protein